MAVLALALALALGGCTGSGVDGPVLTSSSPLVDRGGMAAEVRGTVTLDGDCLLLVQEDVPGGPGYPVVWPSGTRWRAEPPAVVLPGGTVVPVGGAVTGGGGYLQADELAAVTGAVRDAAGTCAGPTGEVAFFNPGSEVTVAQTGR